MVLEPVKVGKKGFTLIELLVVIAVIALLLSVLLPSLRSAKLATKQVVCAAQMRQWAIATLAYAAEKDSVIPPYADTCDWTNSGAALDYDTYWYNRLSPYLSQENYGRWGMKYDIRRCPMGKTNWDEKAVFIGVYYGLFSSERAPFVFLNEWRGSYVTKKCPIVKALNFKMPSDYLMLLDVQRDVVMDPLQWQWDTDYDGDSMNDSNNSVIGAGLSPYNYAQPKIHRGGCNIALFDGHVEWIRYEIFWEIGSDGYPAHSYWFNQNRP